MKNAVTIATSSRSALLQNGFASEHIMLSHDAQSIFTLLMLKINMNLKITNINLNGARLTHATYYIFQRVFKLPVGFKL